MIVGLAITSDMRYPARRAEKSSVCRERRRWSGSFGPSSRDEKNGDEQEKFDMVSEELQRVPLGPALVFTSGDICVERYVLLL